MTKVSCSYWRGHFRKGLGFNVGALSWKVTNHVFGSLIFFTHKKKVFGSLIGVLFRSVKIWDAVEERF